MKKLIQIVLLATTLVGNIYADQIDDFVDRFYVEVLDRESDTDGHTYWADELRNGTASGSDLSKGFIFSNEYTKQDTDNGSFVRTLYKAFFNREADTAGYEYWLQKLNNNEESRDGILNGFLGSGEFTTLANSYGIVATHSNDDTESDDNKGSKGSSDDEKGSKGSSDNENDDENGGLHNQGESCAKCHSNDFNSGVTVFKTLDAATNSLGAVGYKIQLGDTDVYNAGRGDGNSYLTRFTGSKFTAHVIDTNGNIVNSSATLSHDTTRLDCNRCHTAVGTNGAPGRIINSTTQTTPTPTTPTPTTTFASNVIPVLNTKCKSCHGSNGNFTITTTGATYSNIVALKGSAIVGGNYLLSKGSNAISHGGGNIIPTSSSDYATIKAWVDSGAANN